MVDISICLCTFNRADQLRNALDSLFAQHTEGAFTFEIVIVDDGSTDATSDVVGQASAISPVPFRYIRQTNSGVATTRNRGVKEATGEWVAFFDDDQIASPKWLLRLFRVAVKTGAECVGAPCLLMVPVGSEVQPVGTVRRLLGENPYMVNPPDFLSRFDPRKAGMARVAIPSTGNALITRDAFYRVGGFREGLRFGEDFEFFQKVTCAGIKMGIAPDAVIHQVIPASRLHPDYLLPLSERSAVYQADQNWKEHGRIRLLYMVALRCIHVIGWTIPSLLAALVFNRQDVLLAKRCSLHFSLNYLARIVKHFTSKAADV